MSGISSRTTTNPSRTTQQTTRQEQAQETRRSERTEERRSEERVSEERSSRRASAQDYRNVNSETLSQALRNARSVGSPYAEVRMPNGEVVLFPVPASPTDSGPIPQSGEIPSPENLSQLSDAQLQSMGYSAEEIQNFRAGGEGELRTGHYAYTDGRARGGRSPQTSNQTPGRQYLDMLLSQQQNDQTQQTRAETRRLKAQMSEDARNMRMIQMMMRSPNPPMDMVVMLITKMMIKSQRDVQKLGVAQAEKCAAAKTKMIKMISTAQMPVQFNRSNPQAQANNQEQMDKYNRWLQVTNQCLSMANDTLKEVTENLIASPQKEINFMLEFQKNFMEEEFRIKRKIVQ